MEDKLLGRQMAIILAYCEVSLMISDASRENEEGVKFKGALNEGFKYMEKNFKNLDSDSHFFVYIKWFNGTEKEFDVYDENDLGYILESL